MDVILLATFAGSTLFGIISLWAIQKGLSRRPEIIDVPTLRMLQLEGDNKKASTIFTVKKIAKRMKIAENTYNVVRGAIETKRSQVNDTESEILTLQKGLNKVFAEIKSQKTLGNRAVMTQCRATIPYQELLVKLKRMSSHANQMRFLFNQETFWLNVMNADSKDRTLENLIHLGDAVQEIDTKQGQMLEAMNNSIQIADDVAEEFERLWLVDIE